MSAPLKEPIGGLRFPAEWEPQDAVWFAWPTSEELWPGCLPRVRSQLAALYLLAARYQPVCVLCPTSARAELFKHMGKEGPPSNLQLFDYQTDDIWCRDFGPLFCFEASTLTATDWGFNAWGNKFSLYQRDAAATAFIAEHLALPHHTYRTVLEGGAIESNGAGVLLTTEAVLLNPNRNGPVSHSAMESILAKGLGADQVIWLEGGLAGDDTDGHIDNIARFFSEDGILLAAAEDPSDPNHAVLMENRRRIEKSSTPTGRPFRIVDLPLPRPIRHKGGLLAASYLNFLVLNDAVIVPTYGRPDETARVAEILSECYPGREIIGFDCCDIILEGGALHCLSQNQPRPAD